jgi:hypothetical protein
VITDGHVSANFDERSLSFVVNGPDVHIGGITFADNFPCSIGPPCTTGQQADYSARIAAAFEDEAFVFVIRGHQFSSGQVSLCLNAAPVIVREGPMAVPFSMIGAVRGQDGRNAATEMAIVGAGTMHVEFHRGSSGEFFSLGARFDFEPNVPPLAQPHRCDRSRSR